MEQEFGIFPISSLLLSFTGFVHWLATTALLFFLLLPKNNTRRYEGMGMARGMREKVNEAE
jgi:hypothetical protein